MAGSDRKRHDTLDFSIEKPSLSGRVLGALRDKPSYRRLLSLPDGAIVASKNPGAEIFVRLQDIIGKLDQLSEDKEKAFQLLKQAYEILIDVTVDQKRNEYFVETDFLEKLKVRHNGDTGAIQKDYDRMVSERKARFVQDTQEALMNFAALHRVADEFSSYLPNHDYAIVPGVRSDSSSAVDLLLTNDEAVGEQTRGRTIPGMPSPDLEVPKIPQPGRLPGTDSLRAPFKMPSGKTQVSGGFKKTDPFIYGRPSQQNASPFEREELTRQHSVKAASIRDGSFVGQLRSLAPSLKVDNLQIPSGSDTPERKVSEDSALRDFERLFVPLFQELLSTRLSENQGNFMKAINAISKRTYVHAMVEKSPFCSYLDTQIMNQGGEPIYRKFSQHVLEKYAKKARLHFNKGVYDYLVGKDGQEENRLNPETLCTIPANELDYEASQTAKRMFSILHNALVRGEENLGSFIWLSYYLLEDKKEEAIAFYSELYDVILPLYEHVQKRTQSSSNNSSNRVTLPDAPISKFPEVETAAPAAPVFERVPSAYPQTLIPPNPDLQPVEIQKPAPQPLPSIVLNLQAEADQPAKTADISPQKNYKNEPTIPSQRKKGLEVPTIPQSPRVPLFVEIESDTAPDPETLKQEPASKALQPSRWTQWKSRARNRLGALALVAAAGTAAFFGIRSQQSANAPAETTTHKIIDPPKVVPPERVAPAPTAKVITPPVGQPIETPIEKPDAMGVLAKVDLANVRTKRLREALTTGATPDDGKSSYSSQLMNTLVHGQALSAHQSQQLQELQNKVNRGSYASAMRKWGHLPPHTVTKLAARGSDYEDRSLLRSFIKMHGDPSKWAKSTRDPKTGIRGLYEEVYKEDMKYYEDHYEAEFLAYGMGDDGNIHTRKPNNTIIALQKDGRWLTYAYDVGRIVGYFEEGTKTGMIDERNTPLPNAPGQQIPTSVQKYGSLSPLMQPHGFVQPGSSENVDMSFIRTALHTAEMKKKRPPLIRGMKHIREGAKKYAEQQLPDSLLHLPRTLRLQGGTTFWMAMERQIASTGQPEKVQRAALTVLKQWKDHGVQNMPFCMVSNDSTGIQIEVKQTFIDQMNEAALVASGRFGRLAGKLYEKGGENDPLVNPSLLKNSAVDMAPLRPKPLTENDIISMNGVPRTLRVPVGNHPIDALEKTLIDQLRTFRAPLADNPFNIPLIRDVDASIAQIQAICHGMKRMGLGACIQKGQYTMYKGGERSVTWNEQTIEKLARVTDVLNKKPAPSAKDEVIELGDDDLEIIDAGWDTVAQVEDSVAATHNKVLRAA